MEENSKLKFDLPKKGEEVKQKLTFKQWLLFALIWLVCKVFFAPFVRKHGEVREKVRRFKPTVKEGFWGKSVSWELRDRPLTDAELRRII